MGLKGSLSATPFSSVLETLGAQNATGLLRVNAIDGSHFLEFSDGVVTTASRTSTRNPLGELLIARGLISEEQFSAALAEQKTSGVLLGEVLLKQNAVTLEMLETMLRFQVEEEIYDLFETPEGEFEFLQGAHLDKQLHATKGLINIRVSVPELAAEAQRRAEDWKHIRERVPDSGCLMNLTPEGSRLLGAGEGLSIEGTTILRQVALRRSADLIALKACLGRYNTYRMMMELTDAGFLQPASPQEYLQAADNAMGKLEYEEARRLAGTVSRFFPSPHKEQAEHILKRLQQKIAPKTTSARVVAAPGAAQEINRRGTGRPVMQAAPSRTPWIIALVVLVVGGGGTFWFLSNRGKGAATAERIRLDTVHNEALEAISSGRLEEGLAKLKGFTTTNPEVKALAQDLLQKRQEDVDRNVELALNAFSAAQNQKDAAVLKAAIEGLQRVRTIPLGSQPLEERRTQYLSAADARVTSQRTTETLARLAPDFNSASKGLSPAQFTRLGAALAENPPDTILDPICVALSTGMRANHDAQLLLERARGLRSIGEFSAAQAELAKLAAFPASPSAREVDTLAAEIKKSLEDAQTTLKAIQAGASKGEAADALKQLREFLTKPHAIEFRQSGLDLIQSMEKPADAAFAQQLNAAILLYDKDPDASRQQTNALLTQQPFSKAAAAATLRLNVTSSPEGANVFVNGQSIGRTPALLTVAALGGTWISIEQDGFESAEFFRWNLRDVTVNANLSRLPTAIKQMPFPALSGLDAGADRVTMLGAKSLGVCSQLEFKNIRVFALNGAFASDGAPDPFFLIPPLETPFGGVLAAARDGTLHRVALSTGQVQATKLSAAPVGPLVIARPSTRGQERWILVPTRAGLENFDLGSGEIRKTFPFETVLPENAFAGIAAADGIACAPRGSTLHAVNLETGAVQAFPLTGEATGTPVLNAQTIVVPLKTGSLNAFNARDGKTLWKTPAGAQIVSLHLSGGSLVAQHNDGAVELFDVANGTSQGTLQLQPPTLPLVLLQTKGVLSGFVATEMKDGKNSLVASDGKAPQPLWRAELPAKPVALATFEEAIFVSLEDGQLLRFDLRPKR